MRDIRVTVAIPTLNAGEALAECLASLEAQTFQDFETVVIDNSGRLLVPDCNGVRVIRMPHNVGFGAAINSAIASSHAPYIATLNDDAIASPGWLAALVAALDRRPDAGMCASHVLLAGEGLLDSAGMLLCADGSSKQRGHRQLPVAFSMREDVLFPSASAALYRRTMLDRVGLFDADFFLYCEDTDLGLRAVRSGWTCIYEPTARVEHRYSHSAGRVSALKAYYVERNRLYVAIKNFPLPMLFRMPFVAMARYAWHLFYLLQGHGTAAKFGQETSSAWQLPWFVVKAHAAATLKLPALLRKRRALPPAPAAFNATLRRHSISARALAKL